MCAADSFLYLSTQLCLIRPSTQTAVQSGWTGAGSFCSARLNRPHPCVCCLVGMKCFPTQLKGRLVSLKSSMLRLMDCVTTKGGRKGQIVQIIGKNNMFSRSSVVSTQLWFYLEIIISEMSSTSSEQYNASCLRCSHSIETTDFKVHQRCYFFQRCSAGYCQ